VFRILKLIWNLFQCFQSFFVSRHTIFSLKNSWSMSSRSLYVSCCKSMKISIKEKFAAHLRNSHGTLYTAAHSLSATDLFNAKYLLFSSSQTILNNSDWKQFQQDKTRTISFFSQHLKPIHNIIASKPYKTEVNTTWSQNAFMLKSWKKEENRIICKFIAHQNVHQPWLCSIYGT
jgi:hypothetical protein